MKRVLGMAIALAAVGAGGGAIAQTAIPLYHGPAPGSESWTLPESSQPAPQGGVFYFNITKPELLAYPARHPNGTAVILLPGGALRLLGVAGDVPATIGFLNRRGVSVYVLKYRVLQSPPPPLAAPAPPRTGGATPPFTHREFHAANANPSPDDPALNRVLALATDDALAALDWVRGHTPAQAIDPHKVGFLGFSAGGGVALSATIARTDATGPDFVGTIYGPSLRDVVLHGKVPPLFMATEADHGPVTAGLLALFPVWKDAGGQADLHVYQTRGSFPASFWNAGFAAWLRAHGFMDENPARHH